MTVPQSQRLHGKPSAGEAERSGKRSFAPDYRTEVSEVHYSKQNPDECFHVTRAHFQALYAQQARGRWWILEYGKRMRRIIDTECRQVCELQHTHKQCTESKVAKRTGEAGRERERGFGGLPRLRRDTARPRTKNYKVQRRRRVQRIRGSGVSPDYDTTQHAHANNKPSALEKKGGGLWLWA